MPGFGKKTRVFRHDQLHPGDDRQVSVMEERDLHRPPCGAQSALSARMKYLALLVTLVVIYLVLARQTPVAEVKEAMVQSEVVPLSQGAKDPALPANSSLKRPIDRTNEVLSQVKARNGDGEF